MERRERAGIVYFWGENERLKAYNFDFATKRITSFRGEGTQFASGQHGPRPAACRADAWSCRPTATPWAPASSGACIRRRAMRTPTVVHGALVAYDATAVTNGKLKQLFHSDANPANDMGNFAKYATPVVANGKVYVGTFSNKVVQYGL